VTPLLYWKFEASLNTAIERVIGRYKQATPSKIVHDGVDYSGAIARLLYTTAINDKWLRRAFLQSIDFAARSHWFISKPELAELTHEMVANLSGQSCAVISIPTRSQFVRAIFRKPVLLQGWKAIKSFFSSPPQKKKDSSDVAILCFAHQRKFIGLMRPVLGNLNHSYAFSVRNETEQVSLGLADDETIFLVEVNASRDGWIGRTWPDVYYLARRIEGLLVGCKPRLLLYCEGDAWYQDIVSRLGIKHSIPSVCIQWGGFPYETPRIGFRNLACNAFLTWGDYFSAQLKPYNPHTTFIATGHPGVKLYNRLNINKRMVFLLNTDPNGQVIGLDYYHGLFWRFMLWVAEYAKDWKLIVRAHPSIPLSHEEVEKLSVLKNVQIHDPVLNTLDDSLNECDLAVTVSSSAVIEAVSYGAIPFIFNPSPWKFQPNFSGKNAGVECNDYDSAILIMQGFIKNPTGLLQLRKNLVRFRRELFANTHDEAMFAIADVLTRYIDAERN
jgi:hypothetical protein